MRVTEAVRCLLLFWCIGQCQGTELVMSGNFVMTIVNQDGTTSHPSAIVSFDPVSNTFTSNINGGLYQTADVHLENLHLESTPNGLFLSGYFNFIGKQNEYSSGVLQYDTGADQFIGLNNGVYVQDDYTEVSAISYIGAYVVFGGNFNQVESISLQCYLEGKPNVNVSSIVKMDGNKVYSVMEDPEGVFATRGGPVVMMASTGDVLLILTHNSRFFTWDSVNYFQYLYESKNITSDLNADAYGNFFALSEDIYSRDMYLAFFNATNNYQVTFTYIVSSEALCLSVSAVPWKGGILLGNFCGNSFYYFDSLTGTIQDSPVPSFTGKVTQMVNGENDDIWANGEYLFYFSETNNTWTMVAIPSDSYINLIEWDDQYNWLVLYLSYSGPNAATFYGWGKVTTDVDPPSFQLLPPGVLSLPGIVNSVAQVLNAAGDYDTYVGGLFSLAGNTTVLNGSAKYSNGVWHEMDSPGAIGSLYGYQSLLFYSYSYGYTSELNMVATNTLTNEDVFATVPTYVSGSRAPSVFYVFSNYIFVGGSFEVRLPDGTLAYGLIVYDTQNQTWFDTGILSSRAGNELNALSANVIDGVSYLAVSGSFKTNTITCNPIALLNLSTLTWNTLVHHFATGQYRTLVSDLLLDNSGIMYLGGLMYVTTGVPNGVVSTYYNQSSTTAIGKLTQTVDSIVLYSDSATNNYIYASSQFSKKQGKLQGGLAVFPLNGGSAAAWAPAGSNLLFDYYLIGYIGPTSLLYQNGGKGLDGVND